MWNIRLYDGQQIDDDYMLKDLYKDAVGPTEEFVGVTLRSSLRASGRISRSHKANLEINVNRVR